MRSFMRLQQVEAVKDPATLIAAGLNAPDSRFADQTRHVPSTDTSSSARHGPGRRPRRSRIHAADARVGLWHADAGYPASKRARRLRSKTPASR